MPLDVIVGAQWGDEGKGRITDLLASEADFVARFSGGDNAGHTVTVGKQIFKLHLIPSGIVHPHTICLMGAGMVINPKKLIDEIDQLEAHGVDVSPERLKLSNAAHIITPAHLALDEAKEIHRGGAGLGTTRRGIGPAYTDKSSRSGLRAEAMRQPEAFASQVEEHLRTAGETLERIYGIEPPDPIEAASVYCQYAISLHPYLANVGAIVDQALSQDKVALAEGAQGTLLDLDHGTYPYVTSAHPTTPGALLGLGIGPKHLRRIIGVTKAFQTRVGSGPFPTEVFDESAARLRGTGEQPWDEYGTTTGRPRRCGWLDGVLLRYATRINSFTELALTKLDILSGLDPIRICVTYQQDDQQFSVLPDNPANLPSYGAQYLEVPGWQDDLWEARNWDELPSEAQTYIGHIQELTDLPVSLISVGPERGQVIRQAVEV